MLCIRVQVCGGCLLTASRQKQPSHMSSETATCSGSDHSLSQGRHWEQFAALLMPLSGPTGSAKADLAVYSFVVTACVFRYTCIIYICV